jgi:hypothetical protein
MLIELARARRVSVTKRQDFIDVAFSYSEWGGSLQ